MNNRKLSLLAVVITVLLVPGCAAKRIDLVDEGVASVETEPGKTVKILWADLYRDGNETVVHGAVQRRSHGSHTIRTHVDITILSPDGSLLQNARTEDLCVARHVPGKGISWTPFRVRLPRIPAKGSKVIMVVHSGRHDDQT